MKTKWLKSTWEFCVFFIIFVILLVACLLLMYPFFPSSCTDMSLVKHALGLDEVKHCSTQVDPSIFI